MHLQRKIVAMASAVAACGALATTAAAQDDRAGVEALFATVANDKEAVAALVPVWFGPVSADRVGVYAGFIIQLLRNPAFAGFMLDEAGPPGADTEAYLGLAAYAATQTAVNGGVARLPLTDETAYLATGTAFATWVAENHPDACRHIMTVDDPDDTTTRTLQAGYQNTLPAEAIFAYLDLGYRAILAEITDTPAAQPFTEEELQRGYEAYQRAIEAEAMARPNAAALVAAANLEPTAPDADVCEVMLLTLTVVDDLQPPEHDWAVQFILGQQ